MNTDPPSLHPKSSLSRLARLVTPGRIAPWLAYTLAVALPLATLLLFPTLGFAEIDKPLSLLLLPVILSAYLGGLGPGLLATGVAAILGDYFVLGPRPGFGLASLAEIVRLIILLVVGVVSSALSASLHQARRSADESLQRYHITLASIGDAVITTDAAGRVSFLNAEARHLTGWGDDALGRSLDQVFVIINEQTRAVVESPVARVLRSGLVVGLANHTLLVSRNGRETPIDDSGAPIRSGDSKILGVVLVFRDVTEQRRAAAELMRSERMLKLLVDLAPAAIAMFDTEMRYLAASRRFIADYRLPTENLIGRSHYEIFPEIPDYIREIHQRCLGGAIDRCAEAPFPRADGTLDWVRWELHPWYAGEMTVGGLILFSEVITERKRFADELRESEARYHQTLDTMLEGCQIIGFDWRYLYLNDSIVQQARLDREALLGRTMIECFPGIDQTPLFAVLEHCMRERVSERIENKFEYPDGSAAWFDLSVQPSREGLFILSIDISDRKQAEANLRAERAHLAERVAEQTAELRLANAELARATRLKDEFLANMSHELRTPLTAILGRAELLYEGVYGPLATRQAEALRGIEASGQHLLALINDILDLSKIEAGKIEIEPAPVAVEALCRSSLQMVSQAARGRGLSIHTSYDSQVQIIQADERRLKQILVNLLSNAVKFTPQGGAIGLEVSGDPAAGMASFTVWDTGIGIDADEMSQLFQPFVQIDRGLSRQYEGSGLGLALVQRLAAVHGGRVDVESTPGAGSRFRVALPWNTQAAPPSDLDQRPATLPVQREPLAAVSGARILLAEDNEQNSQVITEYLSAHGYCVVVARNGLESLQMAAEEPPTLVLMDIQMPGVDGLETIRRMRASAQLANLPIIALTALAMPGDRERCLAAGANEYLPKPVSLATLLKTIRALLAA